MDELFSWGQFLINAVIVGQNIQNRPPPVCSSDTVPKLLTFRRAEANHQNDEGTGGKVEHHDKSAPIHDR
jgi:hypothetical protein